MISESTQATVKYLAKAHDKEADELSIEVFNHLSGWDLPRKIKLCDELGVKINAHNYYLFERQAEYTVTELINTVSVSALCNEVQKLIKSK